MKMKAGRLTFLCPQVLDFMVRVITPNATNPEAALKLSGGATNAVASERGGRNAAAALITAMEPNLALTDTALFIDSTEQVCMRYIPSLKCLKCAFARAMLAISQPCYACCVLVPRLEVIWLLRTRDILEQ